MNEDITFKKGQFGYIEYKSSNPYEFHQIIKDYEKSPSQDAKGWLLFPEKFSGKLSVWFVYITVGAGAVLNTK